MTPPNVATQPKRVVIVGAGPAGCLAAHLLLMRDAPYHVTLVDGRPDPSSVPLAKQRSWMIGLSAHGLTAMDRVPGLRAAVRAVAMPGSGFRVYVGRRSFDLVHKTDDHDVGYVVDRNWVVAVTMRHLHDRNPGSDRLQCLWNTRCLYVDPAARTVTVQTADGTPNALPYDLCLGCDGIRSIVRNAFLQDRTFEMELTDTFGFFKSIHVPRPSNLDPKFVHFNISATPNLGYFLLPEQQDVFNVIAGYQKNARCAEDLFSKDPTVVEAYMRTHFNAPFAFDWKLFGEQWAAAEWSTTGQVKCSAYHLTAGRCLLMGDAAHATSPTLGQGMNTALADAAALSDLLDEFEDDLDKALPAFTQTRLKEGHALVEMSAHSTCLDPARMLLILCWQGTQTLAHRLSMGLVPAYPTSIIADGRPLSEGYRAMALHGPLSLSRAANLAVRRRWFEETVGLIPAEYRRPSAVGLLLETAAQWALALGAVGLALGTALALPLRFGRHLLRAVSPARPPPSTTVPPKMDIPWPIVKLFSLPWCITRRLQMAPPEGLPDLRDAKGESPYVRREVVSDQVWSVRYTHQPSAMMADLLTGAMKGKRADLLAACPDNEARGRLEADLHQCHQCETIPKAEVAKGGLLKAGLYMEVHMIVCRLKGSRGLLLYSPVRIDDELREWLDGLGTVEWIVSPSSSHTNFVKDATRRYPTARVIAGCTAAAQLHKVSVAVHYDYTQPDDLLKIRAELEGSFAVHPIDGDPIQELSLLHEPSGTLLICDLLYTDCVEGFVAHPQMKEPGQWMGRLFAAAYFRSWFANGMLPGYRYYMFRPGEAPVAPKPRSDAGAVFWPAIVRLSMLPGVHRVCSAHIRDPVDPLLARQLLRSTWGWLRDAQVTD